MKASGGSANPKLAQELLRERLAADGGAAVRVDQPRPPRYPWWQLVLLGFAGLAEAAVVAAAADVARRARWTRTRSCTSRARPATR